MALRLPRPRRDHFNEEVEATDLELAKMLARYDRHLARALLDPIVESVEQLMLPAATELKSPQALQAAQSAAQFARDLIAAAVYVDSHAGRELLDRVAAAVSASRVYAVEGARQSFVWTLARRGPDRWYGFWDPDRQ